MKENFLSIYIDKIQSLILKKYKNKVVSLILFGSLASPKSEKSFSTDVDLIIVVKDTCSQKVKKEILEEIQAVEKQLLISYTSNGFIFGIQQVTGMFINQFVCFYSDFIYRRFHKVFHVNRFISSILAPQESIWISIKNNYQIILGEDTVKQWISLPNLTRLENTRSFFMNLLLSIGTIFLCIFNTKALKFSMEAIKWSLFTWRNFLNLESISIEETGKIYLAKYPISSIELNGIKEFLLYRSKKRGRRSLAIYGLLLVTIIHFRVLQFTFH